MRALWWGLIVLGAFLVLGSWAVRPTRPATLCPPGSRSPECHQAVLVTRTNPWLLGAGALLVLVGVTGLSPWRASRRTPLSILPPREP